MAIYLFDQLDENNYLQNDGSIPQAVSPDATELTIASGEASQGLDLAGFSKIAIIYESGVPTEITYLNIEGNQTPTGTISIIADSDASSGYALEMVGAQTLVFGTKISYVPTMLKKITLKAKSKGTNTTEVLSASVVAYKDGVYLDKSGNVSLTDFVKVAVHESEITDSYATYVGYIKGASSSFVEPANSPDTPSELPTGTEEIALVLEIDGGTFYIDVLSLEEVENSIRDIPDGQTAYDISQDSKVTPGEKVNAKQLWDAIVVEGTLTTGTLTAQAIAFGITTELTAFDLAYSNLDTYLNTTITVFDSMTTTTDIDRDDWNTAWNDYYNARTVLINAIESANKARLDTRPYVGVKLNQDDFSGDIPASGDFYVHGITVDLLEQDVDGRMVQTVDGVSSILSVVKQTKTGILNKRSYLVYSNTEAVNVDTIVPSFYDFNQNGYFTIEIASEVCGVGSTTTNIVLGASASAVDDYYNGMVIKITYDSDGSAVYRTISDYVGATTIAVVSAVDTAPVVADTYEIFEPVTTGVILGWVDRVAGDLTDGLIYDRATSLVEGKKKQLVDTMKYLSEATDGITFKTRAEFLGIEDAFINLAAYNAFITNLFTQNINITSPGYIKSDNYVADTTGFKIAYDGTAEFNNITARGELIATYGSVGSLRSKELTTAPIELISGSTYDEIVTEFASSGITVPPITSATGPYYDYYGFITYNSVSYEKIRFQPAITFPAGDSIRSVFLILASGGSLEIATYNITTSNDDLVTSHALAIGKLFDDVELLDNLLPYQTDEFDSEDIANGADWDIPRGVYQTVCSSADVVLEIRVNSTWRASASTVGGTIFSDGSNVRIKNNSGSLQVVYYMRF